MHQPIIEIKQLRKIYQKKKKKENGTFLSKLLPGKKEVEDFTAVNGIDLTINAGEIFGLLGPNGAGKTTTIKMLCTLLEPTSGAAIVNGYDIVKEANIVRQHIGAVLSGHRSIYWKLTGRENLEYFAALYHIPRHRVRPRIDELLTRLNLIKRADDYVEHYSSGMKQRLAIAKALLANPPILLLDEPTVGLDPQASLNLRELVLEIKAEGRTILLTTHYMEEADLLSDRVGIIDQGEIIALDRPGNLKNQINTDEIMKLEVENFDPTSQQSLNQHPAITNLTAQQSEEDNSWSLTIHTTDSRNALPYLIEQIGTQSAQIRHMQIAQPTLEDVFISLTGKQLRE